MRGIALDYRTNKQIAVVGRREEGCVVSVISDRWCLGSVLVCIVCVLGMSSACVEETKMPPTTAPSVTLREVRIAMTPSANIAAVLSPDNGEAVVVEEGIVQLPTTVVGGAKLCASAEGFEGVCIRGVLPQGDGDWSPALVLQALPPPFEKGSTLYETLKAARPRFPTPMTAEDRGRLMNLVTWLHRDEGWGLHAKPGGNRCPQPNTGIEISCDILVDGAGLVYDVLIDEELVPETGIFPKGTINDPRNFVIPVRP